jgi:5-formyltetrahydrofolate cyclo-ligase
MIKVTEEKKRIRKRIKLLKASLSQQKRFKDSLLIFSEIEKEPNFINATKLLLYWSMDDEVFTHDFIQKWAPFKEIYLPVINGNSLVLRQFTTIDKMKAESRFGIYEPQGKDFSNWNEIEYAIIPGVAFDINNNRLGRGKGFYDRILNSINAVKMGVCFDFQLIDNVPIEPTDIPMDKVMTTIKS